MSASTRSTLRAAARWTASKMTELGIAALVAPHELGAGPLGPRRELLGRRGAERVARGQQHRAAVADLLAADLADRRGLADAVDADEQPHVRRSRLGLEAQRAVGACRGAARIVGLQRVEQCSAVGDLLGLRPWPAARRAARSVTSTPTSARSSASSRSSHVSSLIAPRREHAGEHAGERERALPRRSRKRRPLEPTSGSSAGDLGVRPRSRVLDRPRRCRRDRRRSGSTDGGRVRARRSPAVRDGGRRRRRRCRRATHQHGDDQDDDSDHERSTRRGDRGTEHAGTQPSRAITTGQPVRRSAADPLGDHLATSRRAAS